MTVVRDATGPLNRTTQAAATAAGLHARNDQNTVAESEADRLMVDTDNHSKHGMPAQATPVDRIDRTDLNNVGESEADHPMGMIEASPAAILLPDGVSHLSLAMGAEAGLAVVTNAAEADLVDGSDLLAESEATLAVDTNATISSSAGAGLVGETNNLVKSGTSLEVDMRTMRGAAFLQ